MNSKLLELVKDGIIKWEDFHKMLCAYNTAMAKCQKEIGAIEKLSKGRFSYASYETIRDETAETLFNNGLCIEQWHVKRGDEYFVISLVKHNDGYEEEKVTPMPINDTNKGQSPEQIIGSALTYAKRYAYNAIFGIATYDKDPDEFSSKDEKTHGEVTVTSPECPKCSTAMVKKMSKAGQPFWACPRYPDCKSSLPYKE